MAGMPYPPNLCASVSICGRLSLQEGSVCSAYSVGHSLCLLCWCCRGSCTSVVVFSHGIHGIHGMLGCVIGSVGMAGMPYPPNLCASVSICGRLSLPEGSVCSACSVGHSLCLLCWCCRGSCTSVVVFSHGIHGIHGMLGCVIGSVGMAGMPYPPNLCASVPICGRHFSARMFCVFCVFCGNSLPVCLVGAVLLVQLGWCTSCSGKRQSRAETSAPPKSAP